MAWELDPAHSTIGFSARHMMVTTVRGAFKKFSGELNLDEAHPENSSVSVTIETASIDTGQEARDNHLRGPDFFDVEHYPTITFKSKKVERQGEDRYRLIGDLTIRGVTREVPLDVIFEGEGKGMRGERRAGFTLTGSISRADFGLNWNVALESGGWLVSDKVQLDIDAQVFQQAQVEVAAN